MQNDLNIQDMEHETGMLRERIADLTAELEMLKARRVQDKIFIKLLAKTNEEWADLCHRQRETIKKGEANATIQK